MNNEQDMPLGLAFQMSMNEHAMDRFAKMTEEEKKKVVELAKAVQSKEQMRSIVDDLGKMK